MMQKSGVVRAAAVAAALTLAAVGSPVQAQDWKVTGEFGWFGVGKAFEVEKGHYYWVGEFSGTFFNDKGEGSLFHRAGVKCPAYNDLNFNTGKASAAGYCIISDKEGDQALLRWSNAGSSANGSRNMGTFEFVSGTGKYKGVSGSNTFAGVTQVNWADGSASGYATWNR